MESFTYPAALGGLYFSTNRRVFRVVPITANAVKTQHCGTTHSHDFLQFWYTVSGSWYHTANGVTTVQKPGSATLIFPYTPHSINTQRSDPSQLLAVQVSVKKQALEPLGVPFQICSSHSACLDSHLLPESLIFAGDQKAAADAICLDILSEYSTMNSYRLLMLAASFLELCAGASGHTFSRKVLNAARDRSACIEEALTFLRNNLHRNLTLDEISSAAMMSRRSFTAGFHTITGQSCGDYLRQVRIKEAVELLRKTPMSISQVAQACGFYDASHFYKVCMDLYDTPPLTLRRELSQWTRDYGDRIFRQTIRELSWAFAVDEASWERHRCAMSVY